MKKSMKGEHFLLSCINNQGEKKIRMFGFQRVPLQLEFEKVSRIVT